MGMQKNMLTSKSMAKVFLTSQVGTSRFNKLVRLPRFRTINSMDSGGEPLLHPTRTRALKEETKRAKNYFARAMTFFGFRPSDRESCGWLFTTVNMVLLGAIWPILDFFCEDAVTDDKVLHSMWSTGRIYRFVLYFVSLLWFWGVCKKHDIDGLLFLKVDGFYVSREAKTKGLGGLWIYVAIIQNFGLELACLFVPYFAVTAIGRAWWFFNPFDGLYDIDFHFLTFKINNASALGYRIALYIVGLLSNSYLQLVFLFPCVYFRMVSSLILLEMKAYMAMVQPSKIDEDEDELAVSFFGPNLEANGTLSRSFERREDDPNTLSHSFATAGDAAAPSPGPTAVKGEVRFQDPIQEASTEILPDTPTSSFSESVSDYDASMSGLSMSGISGQGRRSRRASVFDRYGANPFGMYVQEEEEGSDDELGEGYNLHGVHEHGPATPSRHTQHSYPVLREHALLQNVLKLISHTFRQVLLICMIIIFFEAFGTLYFLLNDVMTMPDGYTITQTLVRFELCTSAMLHVVGLTLNLRAILIMTHRLRAVHSIASEQHANLTCKMNFANKGAEGPNLDLERELEHFMKRQALLQYMKDHPLGITIYGFLIDREFLRSFHMVLVSLTVFLVSLVIGGAHKANEKTT